MRIFFESIFTSKRRIGEGAPYCCENCGRRSVTLRKIGTNYLCEKCLDIYNAKHNGAEVE